MRGTSPDLWESKIMNIKKDVSLKRHEQKVIEDLRIEIAKGWDGATSSRNVKEIIGAKRAARAYR